MIPLEYVLKTSLQDVLKISWRRFHKTSWKRLEDVWPRRLEDIFWGQMTKANIFVLIKTSSRWMFAGFFANTEGPGTSFQVAVFVEFFDNFFSFVIWHKMTKLTESFYIPSYLVKCIFYAQAFDNVMKFEYLKF